MKSNLVERRKFLITQKEEILNFIFENARKLNHKLEIQGVVDDDYIYKVQIDVVAPYSALVRTEQSERR